MATRCHRRTGFAIEFRALLTPGSSLRSEQRVVRETGLPHEVEPLGRDSHEDPRRACVDMPRNRLVERLALNLAVRMPFQTPAPGGARLVDAEIICQCQRSTILRAANECRRNDAHPPSNERDQRVHAEYGQAAFRCSIVFRTLDCR